MRDDKPTVAGEIGAVVALFVAWAILTGAFLLIRTIYRTF